MVDYLDDETGRCGQCFLFVVELVLLLWLALGESFGDLWLLLKGITNINKAKQIRNNHLCVTILASSSSTVAVVMAVVAPTTPLPTLANRNLGGPHRWG
jgi:hypothetical protein